MFVGIICHKVNSRAVIPASTELKVNCRRYSNETGAEIMRRMRSIRGGSGLLTINSFLVTVLIFFFHQYVICAYRFLQNATE